MRELDCILEDTPRNGIEILKETLMLLPKQLGQYVTPVLFSLTLGWSQPTIADDIHEQPILVKKEGCTFETICGAENLRIWNRLSELEKLQDGWDGEDSFSINKRVIEKLKKLLCQAKENDFKDWVLFPDARGYLYLDYSKDNVLAGITMTEDTCKYFIINGKKVEKEDNLLFSLENVFSIIHKLQ